MWSCVVIVVVVVGLVVVFGRQRESFRVYWCGVCRVQVILVGFVPIWFCDIGLVLFQVSRNVLWLKLL